MSDAAEDAAAAPEGQVPAAAPLLPTLRKEMKSAELVKYLKEFSSVQFKEYRTPSGVKIFERAACSLQQKYAILHAPQVLGRVRVSIDVLANFVSRFDRMHPRISTKFRPLLDRDFRFW